MARSQPLPHAAHPTDRILGHAPAIQSLRAQIRHLATFDTVGSALVPTLLLQGETGTGKGLVARAIHDSGPRAQGPFVDVNCAAIPETLLEVELFGFEAGAFTDAKRAKPGLFESAACGTLFLDEIDALPLPLQTKLLSALEEKRVRRLGAVHSRQLDVKFITATAADLARRTHEGRFRPDLYHRLAVLLLDLPPLRQRGADILVLAQYFLGQDAAAHGLIPRSFSRDAEAWLQEYDWPGNVRELSHLMERVTLLWTEAVVTASTLEHLCLPQPHRATRLESPAAPAASTPLDEPARIRQALGQTGGNMAQAARLLGLHRGALRYRMRQHGIGRPRLDELAASHRSQAQATMRPSAAEPDRSVAVARLALQPAWEQKPAVGLAIDVTWPDGMDLRAQRAEPWTLAARWQQTMVEKIQGFGGRIVQHSPSLLTAIFGIPQTLEQMPQRAVQAALAIRQQCAPERTLDGTQPGPDIRMAIHLGQVLVDVQASDPTAQLLPLGETLSLPVRLLGHARPGDILLSPQVGRLVEGWFELHGRQGIPGAGFSQSTGAYAVVGLGPRCSPLEVYGKRPLSRFVGRERELAALDDLLTQVVQGRGQVVGIVGEPGVGKSRLCYEVSQAQRSHHWLILESSPAAYGKDTPYLPVVDLLKAYFQLDAGDQRRTIHDKVLGKIRLLDAGLMPILPAVLTLLDVPVQDPQWHALEPPQRRQLTLEACKRLLLRQSQVQPLLLIVENLHWIDTETQAFLDSLVDSLLPARIVLLANYRPEYQHPWGSKTYYTQLRLDPLSPAPAEALLRGLLGEHPALQPLLQLLIARTEGNPLFLEESVRTLVETGVLVGEREAYHPAQDLPTMQMPATVQTVLAARIDRLPPDIKRLLQTAAVIGMEVSLPLLQAIAELPEAAVHDGILYLQAAEFLYEAHLFPEQSYTFKHALTHEVAYGSLLQERRRTLHARIVEALETLAGDRLADQVDRLASHAFRGEVWDKALLYGRQAGERAMERSAYREAVVSLEQALVATQHLPEQRHTLAQMLDICVALRNALLILREPRRGFDYLRQAATLAEGLGDHRQLGEMYRTMIHTCWSIGAYDDAIAYSQRALTLAVASGDVFEQAVANGSLGTVYFSLGDYRRAVDVLRRAIASLTGELLYKRSRTTIADSVRARAWLVSCLAELGEFAEGLAYGAEAVRIANAAANPIGAIFSQFRLGDLVLQQGALDRAIAVLEPAYAHCRAADIPLYLSSIMISLGLAYALSGRITAALHLLDQIVVREETGGGGSSMMIKLGEAYLAAGRPENARPLAQRVLVLSRNRQERGAQAWSLRLLGTIAQHGNPPDVALAETYYQQALALADALGMRPLQAHCHAGLGTLYTTTGRWQQARPELSAAMALYSAMQMTLWLPKIEAALAQVL